MTPERWHRISSLFQEAVDRPALERAAFLDAACAGDESLRREVESLISTDEQASDFIAHPAFELAVDLLAGNGYSLAAGQAIGRYKIISLLGAGGMGEVYLAEDTRLGRKVAIKFLPTKLIADKQAGKRLIREAKAAARLQHPNICTIYDVETHENNSYMMMLTNTRVVDSQTFEAPSASQALLRTVGYIVGAAPAMLGILWAAVDRKHRGWQDHISETVVVRDF